MEEFVLNILIVTKPPVEQAEKMVQIPRYVTILYIPLCLTFFYGMWPKMNE